MEDDINATALSKLPPPPPVVQSRKPEPPIHGMPPPSGTKDPKNTNPPTYAELLREMDHAQPHPYSQPPTLDDYYEDDMYDAPPPPPPRPKQTESPQRKRTERLTVAPASSDKAKPEQGLWKYRHALLVGAIVLLMLLYGIPKLQVSVPSLSSQVAVYKLSPMGAAVVAAASAGIYTVASTYIIP